MKNQVFSRRLSFAVQGIGSALRAEASFRFQCVAAVGVLLTAAVMGATPVWWAILLLTIGAVLTAEMLNTALEHLLDHLHPEVHPMVKFAKDCAAGAVLISSAISVLVFGVFLFVI